MKNLVDRSEIRRHFLDNAAQLLEALRHLRADLADLAVDLEAAPEVDGEGATRFGTTGLATAALNEEAGARRRSWRPCGQKPAMVSRNSARSATLRAIGPCTDCGE